MNISYLKRASVHTYGLFKDINFQIGIPSWYFMEIYNNLMSNVSSHIIKWVAL